MRTRKIEVTLEKTEEVLVHRRKGATNVWCAACRATVSMLTPDQAAALAGVTPRTIYRWIEAGRVHYTEVPDGSLMICQKSLTVSDEAV
jgi:LSD1 subclass zinc finger protein